MTAWEVLNFCEKTPFQALTNSELINNARNLLENSPESVSLSYGVHNAKVFLDLPAAAIEFDRDRYG